MKKKAKEWRIALSLVFSKNTEDLRLKHKYILKATKISYNLSQGQSSQCDEYFVVRTHESHGDTPFKSLICIYTAPLWKLKDDHALAKQFSSSLYTWAQSFFPTLVSSDWPWYRVNRRFLRNSMLVARIRALEKWGATRRHELRVQTERRNLCGSTRILWRSISIRIH